MIERPCTKCNVTKPLSEYHKNARYADGHCRQCKRCALDRLRERYHNDPAYRARQKAKDAGRDRRGDLNKRMIREYGISLAEKAAMAERQGNACAVCRTVEPGGMGSWHIDHDHACCSGKTSCGKCIRGLLCTRCNVMLGMAQDDPVRLLAAANYVANFPALLQALGSPL